MSRRLRLFRQHGREEATAARIREQAEEVEKHGMTVRLGATVLDGKGLSFAVKYFGDFRDDYSSHGGSAELRYDF